MGLIYKILGGSLLGAGAIVGLRYLSKKSEKENLEKIDSWSDEMVAKALEKKLNVPMIKILQLFQGAQNDDLLLKIQNILDSVILNFTKQSSSLISLRLEIKYKDRTSYSATIEEDWDRLPNAVREEFLRKRSKTVSLPWNIPSEILKIKEG